MFLALDRDGNGFIDDGGELFGNRTDQPEIEDPNGYNALAVFDTKKLGGNEDGRIDRRDLVFTNLVVWRDLGHDGVSGSDELYTLEEAGVDAIYLDYWRSNDQDEHGNQLRYFGRVCLSARHDTLATQLAAEVESNDARSSVLDPMGLREGNASLAIPATECEGKIVQSTDVFFVDAGWSDERAREP